MTHIMIDLETLGTRVNAPVIAIGACCFNPDTGEIGNKFEATIDLADAMLYGAASGDTFKWWLQQNDAARTKVARGRTPAKVAFEVFLEFCRVNGGSTIQPWGNGATFDIAILDYAIPKITGKSVPWDFRNVRDCRTINELAKGIVPPYPPMTGVAHSALDDALYQAGWVSHQWQALRGVKAPAPIVLDL